MVFVYNGIEKSVRMSYNIKIINLEGNGEMKYDSAY